MTASNRAFRRAGARGFVVVLLCAFGGLFTAASYGQVNTEKLRVGADQPGFGGHFDLTFALRTGNSDVLLLGSGFQIQHVLLSSDSSTQGGGPKGEPQTATQPTSIPSPGTAEKPLGAGPAPEGDSAPAEGVGPTGPVHEKQVFFLVANYSFSEQNDERAVNSGFSHLRWTRHRGPRLGIEAFAQHQFNEFTNLDTRVLFGLGGRFTLARKPHREAFLGSGYMFEFERLDVPAGGPDERESRHHRWTNYLTVKINTPDDRVLFVNTVYVQPRFDQIDDLRLLNEAELQVKLKDRISFGFSASLAHDSDPPAGIKETDLIIVNRFRVNF